MPSGSAAQNILYGGWMIGPSGKHLWIVEGASDVWKMSSFGAQAVGLFTSKASASQLNRIWDLCVCHSLQPVVCMDGDACFRNREGKEIDCGQKIANEVAAFGLDPQLVYLKKEEDPGSLTRDRFLELTEGLS
jgi:hypothetical protein